VYCFEGIDHADKVFSLTIPDNAKLESQFRPDLLGGVTVITGQCEEGALTAIPYYAWCNRGAGQMQVWMPRK
jgi:hypothetical protein